MKRRLFAVLHACAILALAAGLAALEGRLRMTGAAAASGGVGPDADICTDDHLDLRMARELGPPARPTLRRHSADEQASRALRLRLGAVIETFVPMAMAADTPLPVAAPVPTAAVSPDDGPARAPEAAPAAPAAPAVPPAPAPARRAEARGPIRLDLLARTRELGAPLEASEAFAPKSWVVVVPPPPPPPPPPPEPPRAPPLPFRFAGALEDGEGRTSFFLLRGNAMLTVAVGDTIDNTYTLDSAGDGVLQFTFLPLRERQQLPYGAIR